jgi:hypothetical protein
LEFNFLPALQRNALLRRLESEESLDRLAISSEMPDFYRNSVETWVDEAREYGSVFEEPDVIVIISKARFEDRHYLTGEGNWSIIALGDWDRVMAPPSVVECVLTLLVKVGVLAACKGNFPSYHHETKGCLFDFTARLRDARFKTLTGFLCPACAEVIEAAHSKQLVMDVRLLLEKSWLGDPDEPSHVASMARKLGYPLFRTGGFAPTWKERIKTALEEEGTKVVFEIISALLIAALLLWLGLKPD